MGCSIDMRGNAFGEYVRSHRFVARTGLLASALLMAGCAIHPVQKDVTGLRSVDIVDRVRCESRIAIQDKAIAMLRAYGKAASNHRSIANADWLSRRRGHVWNLDPRVLQLDKKELFFFNRYIETGIAFAFTFDISEQNRTTFAADPVRLITGGTVGIKFGQTNDLTRKSTRRFTFTESFNDILQNEKLPCQEDYIPPNYAYPIAGAIGMQELIGTFIDLNEDAELDKMPSESQQVFVDTIEFTTAVSGTASPHVEIASAGRPWSLDGPASLEAFGKRSDLHKVIVGLSMGALKDTPSIPVLAPFGLTARRPAAVSASGKSPNERKALDAIQNQRIYDFFDRFNLPLR